MVIERFRSGARPVYETVEAKGRQMPDGLVRVVGLKLK